MKIIPRPKKIKEKSSRMNSRTSLPNLLPHSLHQQFPSSYAKARRPGPSVGRARGRLETLRWPHWHWLTGTGCGRFFLGHLCVAGPGSGGQLGPLGGVWNFNFQHDQLVQLGPTNHVGMGELLFLGIRHLRPGFADLGDLARDDVLPQRGPGNGGQLGRHFFWGTHPKVPVA